MRLPFLSWPGKVGLGCAVLAAVSLAGLPGCSKSGTPGHLTGKVTYPDTGHPVPAGIVKLVPEKGQPLSAPITAGGRYDFFEVPPGVYKVTVQGQDPSKTGLTPQMMQGIEEAKKSGKELPPGMPEMPVTVHLPPKYADPGQTPLTLTVQQGKIEPQDFNLTD